jgi:hypothetical protein
MRQLAPDLHVLPSRPADAFNVYLAVRGRSGRAASAPDRDARHPVTRIRSLDDERRSHHVLRRILVIQ